MDFDTLWVVADRARGRPRLGHEDVSFIRDVAPDQLDSFPRLELPASIRHPAGHHALAFSPRLSEGCTLLRPVHTCGDSSARSRRDTLLRLF